MQGTILRLTQKVERRLVEEMERVKHYLDPGTEGKIKEVVEIELIFNHMKTLVEMAGSGMVNMLEDNKIEGKRSFQFELIHPRFGQNVQLAWPCS